MGSHSSSLTGLRIRSLQASGQAGHGGSLEQPSSGSSAHAPAEIRFHYYFVTSVNPATTACAAIQRSLSPISSPFA